MAYDVNKMLSDGYSLKDIGNAMGYDVDKMHKDGYSDDDIKAAFMGYKDTNTTVSPKPPKQTKEEEPPASVYIGPELSIDSNAKQVIDNMPTYDNVDTTSTEPTSVDLSNPDNPTYMSKYEKDVENQNRHEDAVNTAKKQGFAKWTDTEGGEHQTTPEEDNGLEDVSLEAMPFGKLGWIASSHAPNQSQLYDDVANALTDLGDHSRGLEAAAKIIAHTGKYSEEEVLKSVADLPVKDRTLALVMRTKDKKFLNFVKEAIGKDSILASRLQDGVVERKDIIAALGQTKQDLKRVSKQWDEMVNLANSEPITYSLGNISDSLDYIDTLYGTQTGKAATIVKKLKLANENGGVISLGEALDLRKGINNLLRKAPKGTDEIKHLSKIKDSIDSFIANATKDNPELGKVINDTTAAYARTKNNVELSALISKYTSDSGALNYPKLLKGISKLGLNSPEVSQAVKLAETFENKFKLDKHLSTIMTPKGAKIDGLGYIGVGTIARWMIDNLTPYNRLIDKSRFKSLAIQKEIRNAIGRSNSLDDFVEKIKVDSKIPNTIADDLDKTIEAAKNRIKAIEYKPEAKTTGDVNLNPLTATEKGTISENPSEGILKERSDELIRDFVLKSGKSDEVAQKASKILESNRLTNIARKVSGQMKAEDAQGNMKMLQKMVTEEANQLIKAINKAYGVKLPPKEAEKIIKLKINELNN